MSKPNLPTSLARFAEGLLGPAGASEPLAGRPDGPRVTLWRGTQGAGVLKAYSATRTFRQEVHAYRLWLPQLAEVPRLLGVHAGYPPALLLQHLDGAPLEERAAERGAELAAHRCAGAWLRTLHDLPFSDDDPMPLRDAYRLRLDAWRRPGHSAAAALAWAARALGAVLDLLEEDERTPCHRDYEPRNWLVDADGAWLAAIDFEHARPDHALADLSRLAAYVWPGRPELERAFWQGYGAPSDDERRVVHAFAALDAAQRLGWASWRGNVALQRTARRALRALGAPEDVAGIR